MRFRINYLITTALFALTLLVSCGDDDGPDNTQATAFDREALLESLATDLIIPNFQALESSVNTLSDAAEAFVENTNEAN